MTIQADVIFCDDVRSEANGKLIIIGMYQNDILLNRASGAIALSILVRLSSNEIGEFKNWLKVSLNGKELHSIEGTFSPESSKPENAFVLGLPIEFKGSGDLVVDIAFEDGRVINAGSIPIVCNSDAVSVN